ncbi:MAG: ABC transporter ATP-binding protein [Treponema sp.]|nr:ABC transporter ATP-binding protein [Treponema sp.]
MLEVKGLSFAYNGTKETVLDNISFNLNDGQIGIILGKNGCGKTTLFKNILGIEKIQQGEILFDGKPVNAMSARQRATVLAYVPQDVQFGNISVFDTVMTGRVSYFGLKAGHKDINIVNEILEDMGLSSIAHRYANELSGGERRKVAIARALAQSPRLIICDEPTGNLDIANEILFIEEIEKIARQRNISILASLHDLNCALYLGDRFFFIKQGKIKYNITYDEVTPAVFQDIYDVPMEIVNHNQRKIVISKKNKKESQDKNSKSQKETTNEKI